jgi:hypothetical protein
LLRRLAMILDANAGMLADIEVIDNGMPIALANMITANNSGTCQRR